VFCRFVEKECSGNGFVRKSACWRPVGISPDLNISSFGDFPNKMMLDTYMFSSRVKNWIVDKLDARLIVTQ
jgi:hypothetical protein